MKIKKFQIKNLFFIALAAVYFIENNPTIKANTHVRYIFILIIAGYAVSEILIHFIYGQWLFFSFLH